MLENVQKLSNKIRSNCKAFTNIKRRGPALKDPRGELFMMSVPLRNYGGQGIPKRNIIHGSQARGPAFRKETNLFPNIDTGLAILMVEKDGEGETDRQRSV
jgi:hypothetical protein